MLQFLLTIISYGSFLLLLMPATGEGIITTAILFVLGLCLMVHKKKTKIDLGNRKKYLLVLPAILIIPYFGVSFYNLWLPSSKMQLIAALLHMPVETMLLIGSLLLSVLSVYFLYTVLQMLMNSKNIFRRNLLYCCLAAIVTVISAQVMMDISALSMGLVKFGGGVLIVAVPILLLYCLLGRIIPATAFGTGIFMVISTINVYVYKFRGRLFEPVDIFSAGTAMNVAENYSLFPIPVKILIGWSFFAAMLIILYCQQSRTESGLTAKRRLVLLLICAVSSATIFCYTYHLKTYHWQKEGVSINGYILDFVSKFKEVSAKEPDNYSVKLIAELAEQYEMDGNQHESSEQPHIIVIMDEAFSDLRVIGEFATNTDVMPFVSSLEENTISGYALTSVYGGNTANSEYEFLTGNSLAWLSPNVVPYQQYVRSSTYSMVSHLKSSYKYKCIAMHPFNSSGWNRPAAYEHLGFDECYFIEDFPQRDFIRGYVSDQEMFEYLIETFEAQKDSPLFLFGVTMQNHGGYTYNGANYTKHISLNDYGNKFPEVEQYLSVIRETDKAVEYLIRYFERVDEDVIIVFYGDHQPRIDELFYETVSGTAAGTLDEQQKRYKVPFFIWANYDIEEEYIDCTSLNYLSSYVYDAAGIVLPMYNKFLRKMEDVVPAVNANGYYSVSKGCYLPFEEATGEEQHWLELYEALQYNCIFDKQYQNSIFFPTMQ